MQIVEAIARMLPRVKYLNPGLLIEKRLLISWPVIWRTSVTHVLWWSLIGYCALYAAGAMILVDRENSPTTLTLDLYVDAIWVLIALAMAYWLVWIRRFSIPSLRPWSLSVTLLMYFACIYAAAVVPTGFNRVLFERISATRSDIEFKEDYDAINAYNFGLCLSNIQFKSNGYSDTGDPDEHLLSMFQSILPKYGLKEPSFYFCTPDATPCRADQICTRFFRSDGTIVYPENFSSRMLLIKAAKEYVNGRPNRISERAIFFNNDRTFLCLLVAFLLVVLHVTSNASAPADLGRENFFSKFIPRPAQLLTRRMLALDRKMLVSYPVSWSTRINIVFLYNFLVTIFIFSTLLFGFYYLINQKVKWNIFTNALSILPVVIFIGILPTLLTLAFQLNRPIQFNNPRSHLVFISSLFFPSISLLIFNHIIGIYIFLKFGHEWSLYSFGSFIIISTVFIAHGIYFISIFFYISTTIGKNTSAICACFAILTDLYSIYILDSAGPGGSLTTYISIILPISLVVVIAISFAAKHILDSIVLIAVSMFIFSLPSSTLLFSAGLSDLLPRYIFDGSHESDRIYYIILALIFATFLPAAVMIFACGPVYRAVHRIYYSPSDN